jgi:multisubunit Na+/H+ antiporter MnhC subunit
MKACLQCGGPMADVADRCPHCGVAEGASLGHVSSQRDEPLGYERSPLVQALIVTVLVVLAIVAIMWFCD